VWWNIKKLIKRYRKRVRIVHPDGRITHCAVTLDANQPPFGMLHEMVIIVPPDVVVDEEKDKFIFDYLPSRTAVRMVYTSRQKKGN
jgi:hypothetical protein